MKAQGETLLIRKPKQPKEIGGIQLPDQFNIMFAYGRVVSVGPLVNKLLGNRDIADVPGSESMEPIKEGDFVVFDHHGARQLELDPKDAELVAAHASMIFCTIHPKEFESRKLELP